MRNILLGIVLSFLTVGAVLGGGVALGLARHSTGSGQSELFRQREVLFTYQARLNQLPRDANKIDVWVPLAKTTRGQKVIHRQIHAPVPYTIAQDPEYGNDILHLGLKPPFPEVFEVSINYQARLATGNESAADPPLTSDELSRYLKPKGLVIVDDEVRTRARRATAGRTTLVDRARGIYEAVVQQVKYDKNVPGWGRGDTRRACLLRAGNCTDFHSLFISMALANDIPARFKIGVVIPKTALGTLPGYHCWAEFYVEDRGWVPVDASEAWKHPELADYYFGAHDPNRLLISLGRDIQLVPRQLGGPINIFFYPYVEVDGQAFDGVETEFAFQEFNQKEAI